MAVRDATLIAYDHIALHWCAFYHPVLVHVHPRVGRFGLLCQANNRTSIVDRKVGYVCFLDADLHVFAR